MSCRDLLATQIDLTTLGADYVREAHERFEQWQRQVLGDAPAPSDQVIAEHADRYGSDYRVQTEGEHPVAELRSVHA